MPNEKNPEYQAAFSQGLAASESRKAEGDYLVAPSKAQIIDMDRFFPQRRRAKGIMKTAHLDSFAEYVNKFSTIQTAVFVHQTDCFAEAIIDYGDNNQSGHCDHKAVYEPKKTAHYAALLRIVDKIHSQRVIAEFLEDWHSCVEAENEHGATIEVKKLISTVRNLTIEGAKKITNVDANLYVGALPSVIRFDCHPYHDFANRTFSLRFGVRTHDEPAICLSIINRELMEEEIASEAVQLVLKSLGEPEFSVIVGEYEKR